MKEGISDNEPETGNLEAIEAIIGHELDHAIDNHGNNFNADGVLKLWMTNQGQFLLKERTI